MSYSSNGLPSRDVQLRQYRPLVSKIANRLMSRLPANIHVDDLIQVGMLGLLDAMTRYDQHQGVKFETFATQRIQGAMLDDLRENDPMSRGLRKNQKDFSLSISKLEHRLARKPMESEIAIDLGITLSEYQETLSKIHSMQALHLEDLTSSNEDHDEFLDRHTGSSDSDPMNILTTQRMRAALVQSIKDLPVRDQQIMSMYYEDDMNLKEIASVMELTESRISQLMSTITKGLRVKMRQH